ncbi:chloride channel protein, CIC family [Tangfeifania diversioriginum]|uniref:Chloride channel protein, CIC family n=1 Tax=Tangfeifania diversioriginum TaxID=1168035 RepID=A0A1M6CRP0_9BACT|nr:chloride channel protein [Tangfeifania diversioriginum]SHI63464.1 chloride channel protein, CIC family [Tangfeifania diversioriginum]
MARFHRWRKRNMSERSFITAMSILVGLFSGLAAVVLKNTVHYTQLLVNKLISTDVPNYIYFALPLAGVSLTVLVIKFVVRKNVRHGIPNVLHSISKKKGRISFHNLYSSVITSALTVGFGGSVGLEGPTVATGTAWGSWLAQTFRMNYKNTILILACACAGAMAAIFKAPIAAIVFAVEVIMIDLTVFSLVPLLLSSATAVLVSYLFLGQSVLYPFDVEQAFVMDDLPHYILLGILAGFVSVYFTKVYMFFSNLFDRMKNNLVRLMVGGAGLGILIFLFPSLFGEGYEAINSGLAGNLEYLFNNSLFYSYHENLWVTMVLLGLVVLFKIVATSLTFGSGGIGGIFAPTLFMGVNTGLLFAYVNNIIGFHKINENNFALIGMAGLIAGVLHAPLTGIFLIADISGGYELFVPLMITSTFAFIVVRAFTPNSVYHVQLAQRRELLTHDKDANVLQMLEVRELIENDFEKLSPDATLRDLTTAISRNHRNLFPVVDDEGRMLGMVKMDDVRELIFKQEQYDKVKIKDLMYMPEYSISPDDNMEVVANKFESSGRYNLAVIDNNGYYYGFISRARVFTKYRKQIIDVSHV